MGVVLCGSLPDWIRAGGLPHGKTVEAPDSRFIEITVVACIDCSDCRAGSAEISSKEGGWRVEGLG
jgi:hypothetical protein